MRQMARQLANLLIIIGVVFLSGTAGYVWIEKWSLLDALYMTAITFTTVSFGEVHPLSQVGQIFTILLIMTSVGLVTYAFATFSQYLLTPGVMDQSWRNYMLQKIDRIAKLAMRPRVMEFLEFVTVPGDLELALEELTVNPNSELIGNSLAEANIRQRTGATLVSIHRGP